jgi:hypothetical protein
MATDRDMGTNLAVEQLAMHGDRRLPDRASAARDLSARAQTDVP